MSFYYDETFVATCECCGNVAEVRRNPYADAALHCADCEEKAADEFFNEDNDK